MATLPRPPDAGHQRLAFELALAGASLRARCAVRAVDRRAAELQAEIAAAAIEVLKTGAAP